MPGGPNGAVTFRQSLQKQPDTGYAVPGPRVYSPQAVLPFSDLKSTPNTFTSAVGIGNIVRGHDNLGFFYEFPLNHDSGMFHVQARFTLNRLYQSQGNAIASVRRIGVCSASLLDRATRRER